MRINMRLFILHTLIFIGFVAQGQTSVSRQVIGSVTGSTNMSFGTISYSVGEAVISTESSSSYTLTQGFQQTAYSINATPIDFETTNAFSPNGDGLNDLWFIKGISSFGNNTVKIFNRWGNEIRSFDNYDNATVAWDGTYTDGTLAPTGTYFYVIEFPDNKQQVSGWVQITH